MGRSLAANHDSVEPPDRRITVPANSASTVIRSSRKADRACVCQRSERGRAPIASHNHIRSSRSNTFQ
jgi:hypothetical protein